MDEKIDQGGAIPSKSGVAQIQATTTTNDSRDADSLALPTTTTTPAKPPLWRWAYDIVTWTPPRCRWDPSKPPEFSMALNILFAFAGGFTVANLYYNHPILNILAVEFNVSYEKVSQIPTVMQAGYAGGLLFLCPLGDLLKRRPFVLVLVFFTATMWIGLCITSSFAVFSGISFVTGLTTVTPQLMLPLVGDLAPPKKRAASLSIVVSGFMLGILIARVLSGTMTNFVSWRAVYFMALGLQYTIFILLWLFMPDYPSTNPGGLNYFKMLWSIITMLGKHAVLVQACIITFFTACTFTSYWTTLTFLLAGPPYHYTPLVIGLFALIGIGGMCFGPVYAKLVTDRFVPLFSVIMGELMCLVGILLGTYTGTFTVAGPVIQAFLNDLGLQTAQIANRSAIYSIEPKARNRVNTAFMVATFCGQLTGTAAGNHIYARGGWIASGSASVGFVCAALLVCMARGPYEEGWVGWGGGFQIRKKDRSTSDGRVAPAGGEAIPQPFTTGVIVDEEKEVSGRDMALREMAAEEGHEGNGEVERADDASEIARTPVSTSNEGLGKVWEEKI